MNKTIVSPGNLKIKIVRAKLMQSLETAVNAWLATHGHEIEEVFAITTTSCDHVYVATIAYAPRIITSP